MVPNKLKAGDEVRVIAPSRSMAILGEDCKKLATEKSYFKRTKKGTEIAKEVAGLKKFLHDYTYLKEKDIEDTILYDEYIAYAIALGEAKTVEKILIENDKYQNLIKHRVTWWELLNEDDKKYRY